MKSPIGNSQRRIEPANSSNAPPKANALVRLDGIASQAKKSAPKAAKIHMPTTYFPATDPVNEVFEP